MASLNPGVIDRLVFDTSYFRGAPRMALAALRDRGFKISLSLAGFMEFSHRRACEGRIDAFIGRVRTLRPYIDPDLPFVPSGMQLIAMCGGRFPQGVDPRVESSLQWGRDAWTALARPELFDLNAWLQRGQSVSAEEIADRIKKWHLMREHFADPRDVMTVPRSLALDLVADCCARATAIGIASFDPERFNAFQRCTALHILKHHRDRAYVAEDNDAEDVGMLQHIAQPAFFVVCDRRLIQSVDEAGTFQSPWVRTIGELLTDQLPTGVPWGDTARAQARLFRRRSDFIAHDKDVVESLAASDRIK